MKVLLIDNYDSFTFNLYQQIARVSGWEPIVYRNDELTLDEVQDLKPDCIVLSPGPGTPQTPRDFGICRSIIQKLQFPTLGVCLGHQGIGLGFGAKIISSPQPMHGRLSRVNHDGRSIFRNIPSPFSVVRYHSLVLEADLPACFDVLAFSDEGLLMAMRHQHLPFWGVQFHPESVCCEYGDQLICNFLEESVPSHIRSSRNPGKATPTDRSNDECSGSVVYRKLDFITNIENSFVSLYSSKSSAFWLGSHHVEPARSRFVYMGAADAPGSEIVCYYVRDQKLSVLKNGNTVQYNQDLYKYLNQRMSSIACKSDELPFEFNCGYVGYFGYELKSEAGVQNCHVSAYPDALLVFATQLLVFDRVEQCMYLVAYCDKNQSSSDADAWFDEMETRLWCVGDILPPRPIKLSGSGYRLEVPMSQYVKDIEVCLERIKQGESYEVCLTNRVLCPPTADTLDLYRVLSSLNPAPHACYLKFGALVVLSSSPESFLSIDRGGYVNSRPIKGTAARHSNPIMDKKARNSLGKNEKDFSENLMIVDLLRNDLGRVCEIGSVKVSKLMDVEQYSTVYQLVSTIEGQLLPNKTTIDCLRSAFPGGSMTGAPKLRTLEIIDQLEKSARGIYSGSAGFLGLGGGAELNILIRTIVSSPKEMMIGTGGAIVGLSDPMAEFEEILLKARAPICAIELARTGVIPDSLPEILGVSEEAQANISMPSYILKSG